MKFTAKVSQEVIEAVQKCVADIQKMLSKAEGATDKHAATIGILRDRVRDLRYEADLLENLTNTFAEGESEMLLDKRIEAYAAYKMQQIIRDNEPAVQIQ